MPENFRDHLMPLDAEKIVGIKDLDAYQYVGRHLQWDTFRNAIETWTSLFAQTLFYGITNDGVLKPGLYKRQSEGAPTAAMVAAAERLLATLSDEERRILRHPLNSRVWRAWMNPELYVNRFGLRLDEVAPAVRDAVLELMRASLSEAGFAKVRGCMWTNEFLGQLVQGPRILNEFSYNINLYGEPSEVEPWGWSVGHARTPPVFLQVGDRLRTWADGIGEMTQTFHGSA